MFRFAPALRAKNRKCASVVAPALCYAVSTLFLTCTLCFEGWLPLIPSSFPGHCRHVRKRTPVLLHGAVGVLWSKMFCVSVTATQCIVSSLYAVPTLFLNFFALFLRCLERRWCQW